jgi:hypothetical protein
LRADISATEIHDKLIDAVQTRGIRHYLTPTGTDFARCTDFSSASLEASSALVE